MTATATNTQNAFTGPDPAIVAAFDQLEAALNSRLLERAKEIRTALVALIARKHHLQVGLPGVGKTMLVDELVNLIDWLGDDEAYFRWLMTRFTTPEEVFGPPSLKALENDEYRRNTSHKMPSAKVAFLDEYLKANSSILNAMLTILNEGLFFNNGHPIQVPLGTLFCASNELTREPELAALWDRITFRHEVKPLRQQGSFVKMLRLRADRDNAQRQAPRPPVITWDQILQAQWEASQIEIPDIVFDTLNDLRNNLRAEGIEPTERRFTDCIPIIRATAYRSGRSVADVDDMRLLRHVLWVDLKDQPEVDRLVLELSNPLDKEAMDLLAGVDKLGVEVENLFKNVDNEQQRRRQGLEINSKLERAGNQLDALFEQAKKSPHRSEMLDECHARLSSLVNRLLVDLFHINPDQVGKGQTPQL